MNKKLIRIFSLVLYLLLACTLLSGKIQEEMTILVKGAYKTSSKSTGRDVTIDWRSVYTQWNEDEQLYGDHLYEVRDGTGWDQGLRCYDVEGFGLNPVMGIASLYTTRNMTLVQSASRFPQAGKLVKLVEPEIVDDTYLYCYKNGAPEEGTWDLPVYVEVIGQSENALLMAATNVESPFLPLTAKTWTVTTDAAKQVFSLTEAEDFLRQIPGVALSAGCLVLGLVFWCCSCLPAERPGLGRLNGLGMLLSLAFLWYALRSFDFPASLMPSTHFFDISHYREGFSLIFHSLRDLGLTEHSIFQAAQQARSQCTLLLGLFALGSVAIVTPEMVLIIWFRRRSQNAIGQLPL